MFSVDGVNLWQNDFRLNGINDNIEIYGGSSVNSNAAITPHQEFKLQNGNFNAEFGHQDLLKASDFLCRSSAQRCSHLSVFR